MLPHCREQTHEVCLDWVISGHRSGDQRCPLYSPKRDTLTASIDVRFVPVAPYVRAVCLPLLLRNQRVYWNIRWGLYNSSAASAGASVCIERPQRVARKAAFHFEGDRMTPPGKNR